MGIWYATREEVKNAPELGGTNLIDSMVDDALEAASRGVDDDMSRTFYPLTATKKFDWPGIQGAYPWRLWFDANDCLSLTSLVSGGVTIPPSDYLLRPENYGPPFTYLELSLGSQSSFAVGSTYQQSIVATGVWGYSLDEDDAGELVGSLGDTGVQLTVSNSAAVGVGSLLRIDDERLTVVEKSFVDTSANTGADLASLQSVVTVPVADGTAFAVGEVILIDAEQMRITNIAGNNLIVKRAWNGTILAEHTNSTAIYAPRQCTVKRGQLGTTAASHSDAAPILVHVFPGLVHELTIAEAINTVLQKISGYARTVGSGDNIRNASGADLEDIRCRCYNAHGRKTRQRTV